jgi:hypothetical protein
MFYANSFANIPKTDITSSAMAMFQSNSPVSVRVEARSIKRKMAAIDIITYKVVGYGHG